MPIAAPIRNPALIRSMENPMDLQNSAVPASCTSVFTVSAGPAKMISL